MKDALPSMTEMPPVFADPPPHAPVTERDAQRPVPAAGPDVLSEMLRAVRLTEG